MKLRAKRKNSQKDIVEKDSSELINLKKSKKNSTKSSNREFSQNESNLTSHDNSKLDVENESRYKPKLRNIDMNYPGKYKKMNSGKYLYKMKKPEKKPINMKKKTYKYFDLNTVKIMVSFFNKLCDIEFEKMTSSKKKKSKKIDPSTMKLFSDDTLNTNINTKNNYTDQKNSYINNSIFHYNKNINNKNNKEIAIIPLNVNNYYKLNYQNNTNTLTSLNDYNKASHCQNLKKIYDTNMFSRMDANTYEKSLTDLNSNIMYQNPNNIEKRLYSYNEHLHQPQKEIINKNTYNHIIAANFIKMSQEENMKPLNYNNSNVYSNNNNNNCKQNELTAVKVPKESEKSEEKINNIGSNIVENSQKRLRSNSNLAKSFSCNVEDMTKNQLDQIKEIVKGKIEKDTTNVSRKNSEKQ